MSDTIFSGGIQSLLDDWRERGAEALALRSALFGVRGGHGEAEPTAEVILTVDADDPLQGLHPSILVTPNRHEMRVATVPLSRMEEVAAHPAVRKVQIARYLRPALNKALTFVGVPKLRAKTGADGAGVLIGIIDGGIDGGHTTFGHGRILRVWDQKQNGPGVPEGAGLEMRGSQTAMATDERGHGTHVAGIAAGEDATFLGVAPGAKLVIVKSDLLDSDVIRGLQYLRRVASEEGFSLVVVNLSMGGHLDPHDGTDGLSKAVDEFSGPGRIVCCAAGNEGDIPIHASVTLTLGARAEILFETSLGQNLVVLNGWYPGQDDIEVSVEDPNGVVTPFQAAIREGSQLKRYPLGAMAAQVVTPFAALNNPDRHFHIQLSSTGGLTPGIWKLHLNALTQPSGPVHVWSTDKVGGVGVPFRSALDDSMKVGSPGCALTAITVGGYASRTNYPSATGVSLGMTSFLFPDRMIPGSSPGPTRDGRQKPEIAAPGAIVLSALSSQAAPLRKTVGPFAAREGTSMACAMVSGLAALLLGSSPHPLTPGDVRNSLMQSASGVTVQSGTGAAQAGAGLIDATQL